VLDLFQPAFHSHDNEIINGDQDGFVHNLFTEIQML